MADAHLEGAFADLGLSEVEVAEFASQPPELPRFPPFVSTHEQMAASRGLKHGEDRKNSCDQLSEIKDLLSGLPDDLALFCLARVPRRDHKAMRATCRAWAQILRSPEFLNVRKALGLQEDWLFVLAGNRGPHALRLEGFDPLQVPQPCIPSLITMHPGAPLLWGAQMAALGTSIYALGGSTGTEGSQTQSAVWRYCVITGTWTLAAPMLMARSNFACCVLGQSIVVAGGWGAKRDPLSSAEIYDPGRDEWRLLADMQRRRGSCQGAVLQGQVWVVGGIDKRHNGQTTTTLTLICAEVLSLGDPAPRDSAPASPPHPSPPSEGPSEGGPDSEPPVGRQAAPMASSWRRVEAMWRNISLPGSLVVLDGKLLGVADIAGSLLAYSPEDNTWSVLCNMPYPQRGFQLAVLNKGLLLLGVYGGHWLLPQHGWEGNGGHHPSLWDGLAPLHNDVLGVSILAL